MAEISNNGGSIGSATTISDSLKFGGQDIIAQVFYDRVLSRLDQDAIRAYGYQLVGNPTSTPNCIVVIGDSQSAGNGSLANQNWINLAIHGAAHTITKRFRLYNFATSGMKVAAMVSRVSRYTAACSHPNITNKLAVVQGGGNDIKAGTSVSTIAGDLFSLCDQMHKAGWKTVLLMKPMEDDISASVIALNNALASGYSSHCDAVADIRSDSHIGSYASSADATYYNPDGAHMTVSGSAVYDRYNVPAINSIF
jgi:hypothetical protein